MWFKIKYVLLSFVACFISFRTLTRNIRERRKEKVCINIPGENCLNVG